MSELPEGCRWLQDGEAVQLEYYSVTCHFTLRQVNDLFELVVADPKQVDAFIFDANGDSWEVQWADGKPFVQVVLDAGQ